MIVNYGDHKEVDFLRHNNCNLLCFLYDTAIIPNDTI